MVDGRNQNGIDAEADHGGHWTARGPPGAAANV
jgi:hypothetical protein